MRREAAHRRATTTSPPRSGVVLILVLGLSMILLGVAVSFMLRMRSDSQETRVVVGEAQCRLMLHAGLMFIQEESRLGWGEETFGWTDVRDGSLGPRPMRAAGTSAAPTPSWWQAGWGGYIPSPTDAQLPADNLRAWPCPGAVIRCPMAVPEQPPYATQLRVSYNPVPYPAGVPAYGAAGWEAPWVTAPLAGASGNDEVTGLPTTRNWPAAWADRIFDPNNGSSGVLDPQPQADEWSNPGYPGAGKPTFTSGKVASVGAIGDWGHLIDTGSGAPLAVQLAVRGGTDNLCWFRIYREIQSDHDGDGVPDYDYVLMYDKKNPELKNWNVFIIACGVGATHGYRFWDLAELTAWEGAHNLSGLVTRGQEFAADSPMFSSIGQSGFAALRSASQVQWFRVEWTALQGGGFVPERYSWGGTRVYQRFDPAGNPAPFWKPKNWPGWDRQKNLVPDEFNSDGLMDLREGGYADGLRYSAPKTYGGNFKWVQRLDHEPANW